MAPVAVRCSVVLDWFGEGFLSSFKVLEQVRNLTVSALNSTCLHLSWRYPDNAGNNHSDISFIINYRHNDHDDTNDNNKRNDVDITNDGDITNDDGENTFTDGNSADNINNTDDDNDDGGDGVGWISTRNSSDTEAVLCGLQYWTRYEVKVRAMRGEELGRTSVRLQRTGEHVPGAVRNVTMVTETDIHRPRSLHVTWTPPRHANGVIHSYYVIARNINTSEVIETKESARPIAQTGINDVSYDVTLRLTGDHHYHVQIFAATGAGNGTKTGAVIVMSAGVLPHSRDVVSIDASSTAVTSVAAHIPTSLLCDFSYGAPVHAGYLVYTHGWTRPGISQGISLGSSPVVTSTWSSSPSRFFVDLDVLNLCAQSKGSTYLPILVGADDCRRNKAPLRNKHCSGPLLPNTLYHLLVVYCTSEACTYTLPDPTFRTRPEEESDSGSSVAGLAGGVTVLLLAMAVAGGGGYYYFIYKKQARDLKITPPTEEESIVIVPKYRPVALDQFVEHVQQLHKDSNLGFAEEYKVIKDLSPTHSTRAAKLLVCNAKNRYMNILPWDRSRVKLIPTDDEEGSDYINANYIPGENHQREFIAAQGPLPATIDDFWRMVWENRVCVMVMLTQCVEKGKTKCEQYWPVDEVPTMYGDLMVQVRSQSVLPDYNIRVIDIKLGSQSRMIKHFHFMRWPDHGCPERTSMLLNFVSSVRAHMPHSGAGPTLVHCSAGVGRTGTFIALDRLLLQIRQQSEVDIFNLVLTMRDNRMQMVQTENQYVYIHDCLSDALTKDKESDDDDTDDEEDEHIYGNC